MGLQAAFFSTRSALAASAAQTANVSKNIANVNEANYARRVVSLETFYDSGVRVDGVQRATAGALSDAVLSATSRSATDSAISDALTRLKSLIGDPQSDGSPSARIGALQNSLVAAASAPESAPARQAALEAASNLASALRDGSAQVSALRADADAQMMVGVQRVNKLLADFDHTNREVVRGTHAGVDVSDALDKRDAILKELSGYVGVSTTIDPNGSMAIYADGGATLYQDGARSVQMQPSANLAAGATGGAIYIDGVAVTGPNSIMKISEGSLSGLARVRDSLAPDVQSQLDEVARGLITSFSETDQSATPTAPARTGLFTWNGAPGLPAAGTSGVASQLQIDPAFDPAQGGNLNLLRDGGAGGAAYVYNQTGAAGYSARLSGLAGALTTAQTFSPGGVGSTSASVIDFATQFASRFETMRQSATQNAESAATLSSQAEAALSNVTGVNLDDQMTQMLDFERSYQTAAKMMSTINQMYSALFDAVR
jgi:flagellar hook-associated protein 1 FlgK